MTGQLSTHAAAAKALRQELKQLFPDVRFSLRSKRFAGGTSLTVSFSDWLSPTQIGQLKAIADKYQYGSFDGMTDSYSYTNSRDDLPQVKYVHIERRKD